MLQQVEVMNDAKSGAEADKDGAEKLTSLNQTLTGVENELMGRALDRRDAQLDQATDFINKAAEDGVIDIECGGDDEGAEGEGKVDEPPAGGDE